MSGAVSYTNAAETLLFKAFFFFQLLINFDETCRVNPYLCADFKYAVIFQMQFVVLKYQHFICLVGSKMFFLPKLREWQSKSAYYSNLEWELCALIQEWCSKSTWTKVLLCWTFVIDVPARHWLTVNVWHTVTSSRICLGCPFLQCDIDIDELVTANCCYCRINSTTP